MFDYSTAIDMTDDQLLDAANLMTRQGEEELPGQRH